MLILRKTHRNFTKALLPAAAFVLAFFPSGLHAQAANQRQT